MSIAPITDTSAEGDTLRLSIVLPYYKKLREFERVLPLNAPWWSRSDIEVLLVLDEPSEEAALVAYLAKWPTLRWRVVVNDAPHDWRPPCIAINVGLRQARGTHVLILSPESACVGDVPAFVLAVLQAHPDAAAIGRVCFTRFDAVQDGESFDAHFDQRMSSVLHLHTFYGSIAARRDTLMAVGGYDESFTGWGGDDDNVRVRLEMAGYRILACPRLRVLHFSFEDRPPPQYDIEEDFLKCTPAQARANAGDDWGRAFSRVAYAHEPPMALGLTPCPVLALPDDSVVLTGTKRRCAVCGRMLHFERPAIVCVACKAVPEWIDNGGRVLSRRRVACVMQVRNEARFLPGCLDHLRDYVDGFIVLDDGSVDGTSDLIRREPKCLAVLPGLATEGEAHVWRERDNQRRLLNAARALGMDWVLVCDADERYERIFLEQLQTVMSSFPDGERVGVHVSLCELWDSAHHYRTDGLWGKKGRLRLFTVPDAIDDTAEQALHGRWLPESVSSVRHVRLYYRLYHLKMIHRADRLARRDFYKALDPEHRFQSMGYDYLAEEGAELRLQRITPERDFDRSTLPVDLQE